MFPYIKDIHLNVYASKSEDFGILDLMSYLFEGESNYTPILELWKYFVLTVFFSFVGKRIFTENVKNIFLQQTPIFGTKYKYNLNLAC